MAPPTLRALLPLPVADIASVAALVAELVARLHERGVVHGSIGIDDVLVARSESGELEVGLTAPSSRGSEGDDVAAIGSMITAALAMSRPHATADHEATRALEDIAARARRATLNDTVSASGIRGPLGAIARHEPGGARVVRRSARTPGRWAARFGLCAWLAVLVATVAWLPRVATEVSPPPLLEGATALGEWFAARDAPTASAGVLRMLVHGIALYLLASTVVACAMQLVPFRAAHRIPLLDRLTLTPVRRVVHAAFGVGLTIGALTSLTPEDRVTQTAPSPVVAAPALSMETPPTEAEHPAVVPPALPATWTVRPGDHFWNIAERLVTAALERPATDAEIDPYWRLLVEANRNELVDPDNADLLFEGQLLGVPPLPVPPETPAI